MEDLLAKFYGKPEPEGSSDAPKPNESTPQPQHDPQLEQRVSLVETQLLQIAKAQQTILSRLDTMIEQQETQPAGQQEPPPVPPKVWRPAWTEPRPELPPAPKTEWQQVSSISEPEADESIGEGDGTPITWDPVNKTLHAMDDASEEDFVDHKPWEDPGHQERERRSSSGPKRTCTICGRQFPMRKGHMARSTKYGPETLHCPKCYGEYLNKRQFQIIGVVVVIVIIGIVAIATAIGKGSRKSPSVEELDRIPMEHLPRNIPDPFRKRPHRNR